MSEMEIRVDHQKPLTVQLIFKGEARYVVLLWKRVSTSPERWIVERSLENNGTSWDAKLNAFTFQPPARGEQQLLYIYAAMTHVVENSSVSATAEVLQEGLRLGAPKEVGTIKTGFIPVIVRAMLVGA
jgi:hypothetical protein